MSSIVAEIKDVWFMVLALVALVAWSVRLEALVKNLEQKLAVLSGMMRPDKMEDRHTWQAEISKDVEYLRRDVDEIRKAGL